MSSKALPFCCGSTVFLAKTVPFLAVCLSRHKQTKRVYALKCMEKTTIDKHKQKKHIMNEKRIMQEMNHPFLVRVFATYKDAVYLYMLLELCQGGEVFSRLVALNTLDEGTTQFYAGCIVLALGDLHAKNNIYRDLKPENVLLDLYGYAKITDFGFAKKVEDRTYTRCGTPEYVPPEMLGYDGHHKGTVRCLSVLSVCPSVCLSSTKLPPAWPQLSLPVPCPLNRCPELPIDPIGEPKRTANRRISGLSGSSCTSASSPPHPSRPRTTWAPTRRSYSTLRPGSSSGCGATRSRTR
eukprot:SAG22_NODE_823_length_6993_cov_6.116913_3_plen_295_part_00